MKENLNLMEFIENNFFINKEGYWSEYGEMWCSKEDGSPVVLVGQEEELKFYTDLGITDNAGYHIGFNKDKQCWVSWWQDEAVEFKIGSKVEKFGKAFIAKDKHELLEHVKHVYKNVDVTDISLNGHFNSVIVKTGNLTRLFELLGNGKGEWVAKSLEDAKQMAKELNGTYERE